ncbi:hypothetical protein [Paenibacillus sp. YYML68]|uniref:hypothetical protein n=1 Tax=Paenibacillus sp. YYML68 TaxID=2909250 RepID=UPI0024924ACF|nr:hypothetical protein [Paenibacillus sp. YYML68]
MEAQTQTGQQVSYGGNQSSTISVKDWMITMLILMIPLVNLIMLFVWAFGGGASPSKANFAKANLIWAAIGITLYILVFIVFGAALLGNLENLQNMQEFSTTR